MSDTIVSAQTTLTQALVVVSTNAVVAEAVETQVIVTSLGSQGVQGPTGASGATGATGAQGPASAISTASDVDISTIKTGSLLIYNQSTDKWTANDVLSAQYVDCGQY